MKQWLCQKLKAPWIVLGSVFFSPYHVIASTIDIKYEDLPELIEKFHPLLESRRLQTRAYKARQGSLGQSFKPRLELSTSIESFQLGRESFKTQPSYSAIGLVNLYNGGRDRLYEKGISEEIRKNQAELSHLLRDRLANVRRLYWEFLFWKEFLVIHEEAILRNHSYLKQALQRISAGRANETDRVEFEMKTVALAQQRDEARLELKRISREFVIEIGLDSHASFEIAGSFRHEHADLPQEFFDESHHQAVIERFNADITIKSIEYEMLNRLHFPQVDAFGGFHQYNEREREASGSQGRLEKVIGMRLTVTLDSSSMKQKDSAALQLERQSLEQEKLYRLREIEEKIKTDRQKIKLLDEQIHEAEENIKRAKIYLALTLGDYQRGVKNSSDVVGAADKFMDFKLIYAEKIRDYYMLKGDVLTGIGK